MLHKDMGRAKRRWKSYCTFIRRLRTDWNDHGWKQDPVYERGLVDGEWVVCGVKGTTLCECFNLTSPQALRFKDTPTGSHSKRNCGCSDPMKEYKDARKLEVERENLGKKPKRRKGIRRVKHQCSRCGFLIGMGWVEIGRSRSFNTSLCEGCARIMKQRATYWRNGKPIEYDIIKKEPA